MSGCETEACKRATSQPVSVSVSPAYTFLSRHIVNRSVWYVRSAGPVARSSDGPLCVPRGEMVKELSALLGLCVWPCRRDGVTAYTALNCFDHFWCHTVRVCMCGCVRACEHFCACLWPWAALLPQLLPTPPSSHVRPAWRFAQVRDDRARGDADRRAHRV